MYVIGYVGGGVQDTINAKVTISENGHIHLLWGCAGEYTHFERIVNGAVLEEGDFSDEPDGCRYPTPQDNVYFSTLGTNAWGRLQNQGEYYVFTEEVFHKMQPAGDDALVWASPNCNPQQYFGLIGGPPTMMTQWDRQSLNNN